MKRLLLAALLPAILSLPTFAQNVAPSLQLEECRVSAGRGFPSIKARCGNFERLTDPADENSEMLQLFVAVVPALSLEPEPDPFVPIAGGPGQASSVFYAGVAPAFSDVRRNRDIVLIDQRGTGKSAPMICEVDEEVIEGRYTTEETVRVTQECIDDLPHDPRFFTTSVAVADLEALRLALGYAKFNLYGISYGTRVAQHFLRQYPDSTRSVILDGVVPPQLALGPAIAVEAQNTLEIIFDRCAENEQCAERFPNLQADFKELNRRLIEQPVDVTLANPLRGGTEEISFGDDELAGAIRLLSYHPSSVALIPLLIDEAVQDNFIPLAAQVMMISENMQESINLGMHNSVMCTEDAPYFEAENVSQASLEATYIGPVLLEALQAMCSVWPRGVIDDDFKTPIESDIPVLLLSGEADPITPPRYADLAAVDLGNARHLVGEKQGHGQAPRGCFSNIIGDFVDTASVDELETDCLDRLHAMPFFLDYSGPSP